MGNLETPSNLTPDACLSGIKPRTLLWRDSAYHCTLVLPTVNFIVFFFFFNKKEFLVV